jgi:hypothetical protein
VIGSRSLSESAAAWQQWTNRRIEVVTQDGSRLFALTSRNL